MTIALRQELQRLPDDQRGAFLLVVSQGLSYAEASAATGVEYVPAAVEGGGGSLEFSGYATLTC